ncbi:MAG: hypothetical protein ACLSAH_05005 [Bilophila wadsworthia]
MVVNRLFPNQPPPDPNAEKPRAQEDPDHRRHPYIVKYITEVLSDNGYATCSASASRKPFPSSKRAPVCHAGHGNA